MFPPLDSKLDPLFRVIEPVFTLGKTTAVPSELDLKVIFPLFV